MKQRLLAAFMLILAVTAVPFPAYAANYVKPDVFKQWLESGKQLVVVDIQPAADFERQHFKEAIETNAFPAKTDEEKKRIDKALSPISSSKGDVIIICPRGRSGASNTYDYLKSKGVSESKLYILEGGIEGWPHKNLLVQGR